MSCTICETRREKRFCPALHERICPQCCGEGREVTIDCPSDCVYLQQAWEHEKSRPLGELDRAALFPEVELPQQFLYEQEHLIVGLSYSLGKSARGDRTLTDQDILAALNAMARTYETLVNSGLHYQISPSSLGQQAVIAELEKALGEYRELEKKHRGFSALRESDVLRALVFLVRMGHARTSGRPKSRAWLHWLFDQFPVKDSVIASPQEAGGRIVMP